MTAYTAAERQHLVRAAEQRAGLAPAVKGADFGYTPFESVEVLQHPSGIITHGPGASDLMNA